MIFDCSLNEQVAFLSVNPHFIALHNDLLVVGLSKLLIESKWVESKSIVERHLILDEAVFVPLTMVVVLAIFGSLHRVYDCGPVKSGHALWLNY
jgi:hypothetical protein